MTLEEKEAAFRAFWEGRGPSLILIPAARRPQYYTDNYVERFQNAERMWEAEAEPARELLDWPTDGIPTVRPNLGVVFIPGAAGQSFKVQEGQMPWPGEPLSRNEILSLPDRDIEGSGMMCLARRFYEVHRARRDAGIAAYHPDTQGPFSLAHLLYGDRIFCDAAEDPAWVHELLGIVVSIHRRVIGGLKSFLGEPNAEMTHGHSFPAGVYFPNAGVRISEDTATMLSPRMVGDFVLPNTERAAAPWGGCFVHFCGKHEFLLEQLCRMPHVRAIDLGNPEMYDTRRILELCGETGTVLFSPVPAGEGETWIAYVRRIAALAKATGARLILRPTVFPDAREECGAMLDLWHELTGV